MKNPPECVTVTPMIEPRPNRLKEIREKQGVERYDICAHLRDLGRSLSDDTVRRWEENRGGPIPSQYIEPLSRFLGVDPSYLMGWDRTEVPA